MREMVLSVYFENARYQANLLRLLRYAILGVMVFAVLYYMRYYGRSSKSQDCLPHRGACSAWESSHVLNRKGCTYDARYPLSKPLHTNLGVRFKIAAVADLDAERSRVPNEKDSWRSFMKRGYLTKHYNGAYTVTWEPYVLTLTTSMNEKGRGLELSDLCVFNSKLYTIDDRTGIVYQIFDDRVIPWVILNDGPGMVAKGFKSEWMTVKDGALFVGGLGKEWTTVSGEFINFHPMFVKSIDQYGGVVHHNWTDVYLNVRAAAGITYPGYMVHEAVSWSPVRRRWYFLPRRMSQLKYDDASDERRGANVLIHCDENFADFQVSFIGKLEPTHGFSSFKFVPDTNDEVCVALKTVEVDGVIQTYILVFHIDGTVIMPEQLVDDNKFEGIEFI